MPAQLGKLVEILRRTKPVRTRSVLDVANIIAARVRAGRSASKVFLAAMSGIDGSGKSHLSKEVAGALKGLGLRVALIGIDPWQNPQSIRFGGPDRGRHFYNHVIRFDELFAKLVDPLVSTGSIRLQTKGIRTDRDAWDDLVYDFKDIDVVLIEGILLFRKKLVDRYDLRIWVDCSFETAVRRALARNVEDLPVERLVEDYAQIYHAAQRYHFEVDAPRERAEIFLLNDDGERQE